MFYEFYEQCQTYCLILEGISDEDIFSTFLEMMKLKLRSLKEIHQSI